MSQSATPTFSDYIVYVDESGDHSLESINPEYPLFVLSFCIFRKDVYANNMTPAVRKLKFWTFGHDMVVLHEIDIRKKRGSFAKLSKEPREAFLNALTDIIDELMFDPYGLAATEQVLVLAARSENNQPLETFQ